eukprot:TRINITY_DN17145_c0_g1_i2.p1 TRINITY_DN17145_c0_g1~~TRINITY_DN17145_c0_g1_i2.p1  ORF type:complete len:156 (+),score=43.76 TRINITY_DN17145_c0_g1_i2:42-509(+)
MEESYDDFLTKENYKAFAVAKDSNGGAAWGAAWGMDKEYDAVVEALKRCDKHNLGYELVSPTGNAIQHKTMRQLEADNLEMRDTITLMKDKAGCTQCQHTTDLAEDLNDTLDLLIAENAFLQRQLTEEALTRQRTTARLRKEINQTERSLQKIAY